MAEITHIFEFFSKLVFGIHLTLSFSGVSYKTDKKSYRNILYPLLLALTLSFFLVGEDKTIMIYPVLIHIPLVLYLNIKMKNPLLHATVSLFFAFQFLTPRIWLGSFVANFFGNGPIILDLATILVSIPLAFVIDRYFAPEIAAFKDEENKIVLLIGLAPIAYYVMTYMLVIYSDMLLLGGTTLVDLFDGAFIFTFLLYTVFTLKIVQDKKQTEVERAVLLVLAQANYSELSQLHKQQEFLQTYRHDFRHHVNYIDGLLIQNQTKEARKYLNNLLKQQEIEVIFASDESVKLLLSQFQKASEQQQIRMEMELNTSDFSGFDQLQLCGLLSNGLENALKFSKEHETPEVFLEIHRDHRNLSIFIKNSYAKLPEFHNLRPITKEKGHGYGTKSMSNIVENYHGFSQFYVENNYFIFRATLMATE